MYVYCVALLVIATAPKSEAAWDIYRIPLDTEREGSNTNRQINLYYPNNDVGSSRKGFNGFFNYDDFGRGSLSYDDFSNEWNTNSEQIRTERQQLFPQNPVQTASDITLCVRNCPATSEYNPVCGSNGVTYTNPSRLECAKFCGVAVQVSRFSRCPEPGLPSTDVSTPPPSIPTPVRPTPVNPTPVRPTPVNPTPVRPTPVNPIPVRPTPVNPTPTPPTPLTNPTTPSTTATNPGFTVPKDILDSIFSTTDYGSLINERHDD